MPGSVSSALEALPGSHSLTKRCLPLVVCRTKLYTRTGVLIRLLLQRVPRR